MTGLLNYLKSEARVHGDFKCFPYTLKCYLQASFLFRFLQIRVSLLLQELYIEISHTRHVPNPLQSKYRCHCLLIPMSTYALKSCEFIITIFIKHSGPCKTRHLILPALKNVENSCSASTHTSPCPTYHRQHASLSCVSVAYAYIQQRAPS